MTLEESIREAVAAEVAPVVRELRETKEELRQLRRVLPPAFGTKKQAAQILGVCEKTITNAIARGEIEAKRVGSRVVIDLSKLHVDQGDDELQPRRARAR